MRRSAVVVAVALMCAGSVLAQKPEMPKPGPEHERLGAFVGNWTFNGEMKPGLMGPGGEVTGTDRTEWMPGKFFVQRSYRVADGEMQGTEIFAYDAAKKVYTYNSFDSSGVMGSGTMTVKGSTWTVSGASTIGAMTMRDRCTLAFGDGGSTLAIKCEVSTDGTTWSPGFEGTATKTK